MKWKETFAEIGLWILSLVIATGIWLLLWPKTYLERLLTIVISMIGFLIPTVLIWLQERLKQIQELKDYEKLQKTKRKIR